MSPEAQALKSFVHYFRRISILSKEISTEKQLNLWRTRKIFVVESMSFLSCSKIESLDMSFSYVNANRVPHDRGRASEGEREKQRAGLLSIPRRI